MSMDRSPFQFVTYSWDDAYADQLDPVARLVYRANVLGADVRITNTGSGNTSAKLPATDPLSGARVEVLWLKGATGDLRTVQREAFASLDLAKLHGLQRHWPAPPSEATLEALYQHATFNLNPCPAPPATALHGFVPYCFVDHTLPQALLAIAATRDPAGLIRTIYGAELLWLPWQHPGFALALKLETLCRQHPQAKGVLIEGYGLLSWADDDKVCYAQTLELIERAARAIAARDQGTQTFGGQRYQALDEDRRHAILASILPWLRGQLSQTRRLVGTVQEDEACLRFVNSHAAPRLAELGTRCLDHLWHTKVKPLYVDWHPQAEEVDALRPKLVAGLTRYRQAYTAYYENSKAANTPAMRDPNPTVILIPGFGMITWGHDKSASRIIAETYHSAIEVLRGAEALDAYTPLPLEVACAIEYGHQHATPAPQIAAPEPELARQIIAVVGAGSGIGRELALRLVAEGAHVVCVDKDGAAATATAMAITEQYGAGSGQAGSDISGCGPAIGLHADITERASVRTMVAHAALAYGGLDAVAVTAGIFVASDPAGRIRDDQWAQTFAVNVTGFYIVADEVAHLWKAQGLPANLVLTTSVHAVVAKPGSLAYDTSKAAANHLVRELAVTLAPLVRVNAVAPATVVLGNDYAFPRERVLALLAQHNLGSRDDEPTEALRQRLAQFYAERTLLKCALTPAAQAEAFFLLLSNRLSQTTGQILCVDGGRAEAFLR